PQLTLYPYRGATYGYLGFNLAANGDSSRLHPLFGDRELRRALVMAVDRERLLQNVWGDAAKVPPGPEPQLWWIWDPETRVLPHDTAQASRLLTRLGWRPSDHDGVRERRGNRLAFRIMVPTTSAIRRQYARLLQEQYRAIGAEVELDEGRRAAGHRAAQPGRPGRLSLRVRERGGRAPAGGRRHDPAGLVAGAAPHLAHSRRAADRSRPRGALGDGVVGAARRRRDRHR